jgi:hypothetical protein
LLASLISYGLAWFGALCRESRSSGWWRRSSSSPAFFATAIAPLWRMLGLRLLTPQGEGCGYGRSIVRNLPLIIPPWNLLEAALVVAGRARTGDRIARTIVTEE